MDTNDSLLSGQDSCGLNELEDTGNMNQGSLGLLMMTTTMMMILMMMMMMMMMIDDDDD